MKTRHFPAYVEVGHSRLERMRSLAQSQPESVFPLRERVVLLQQMASMNADAARRMYEHLQNLETTERTPSSVPAWCVQDMQHIAHVSAFVARAALLSLENAHVTSPEDTVEISYLALANRGAD